MKLFKRGLTEARKDDTKRGTRRVWGEWERVSAKVLMPEARG